MRAAPTPTATLRPPFPLAPPSPPSLRTRSRSRSVPPPPLPPPSCSCACGSPLFVTWNTRPSRPGRPHRLRGCIGTFEPHLLSEGLAEYALISAFRDTRFRRIEEGELESLECAYVPSLPPRSPIPRHVLTGSSLLILLPLDPPPSGARPSPRPDRDAALQPSATLWTLPRWCAARRVSLLTEFEDADSYLDWTVGVHGIHITFPHPSLLPVAPSPSSAPSPLATPAPTPPTPATAAASRPPRHTFSATYLPQVAEEQGWDKLETIDSAIRKAGWSGRISEDLRRAVRLRRYQSRACEVSWEDYARWRTAHGGAM